MIQDKDLNMIEFRVYHLPGSGALGSGYTFFFFSKAWPPTQRISKPVLMWRRWNSCDRMEQESLTPSIHQIQLASFVTDNIPCIPLQVREVLDHFTYRIFISLKDLWMFFWKLFQTSGRFSVVVKSSIFVQQQNPWTFQSDGGSWMALNHALRCLSVNQTAWSQSSLLTSLGAWTWTILCDSRRLSPINSLEYVSSQLP